MRLHVGMLGAEELLRTIDRQLLDLVHHFAPTVVALLRQPLGVLVGERAAHGLEHRERTEVLARDQLEAVLLPGDLPLDQLRNLWVGVTERRETVGHCSIFSTRR